MRTNHDLTPLRGVVARAVHGVPTSHGAQLLIFNSVLRGIHLHHSGLMFLNFSPIPGRK